MALNASTLAALIKSKMDSKQPVDAGLSAAAKTSISNSRQQMAEAIAEAVVTHITTSAQVTAAGADPQGGAVTVTGTVS